MLSMKRFGLLSLICNIQERNREKKKLERMKEKCEDFIKKQKKKTLHSYCKANKILWPWVESL